MIQINQPPSHQRLSAAYGIFTLHRRIATPATFRQPTKCAENAIAISSSGLRVYQAHHAHRGIPRIIRTNRDRTPAPPRPSVFPVTG